MLIFLRWDQGTLPSEGPRLHVSHSRLIPDVEEQRKKREKETRLGMWSDSKPGLRFSLLFLLGPVTQVPLQHRVHEPQWGETRAPVGHLSPPGSSPVPAKTQMI